MPEEVAGLSKTNLLFLVMFLNGFKNVFSSNACSMIHDYIEFIVL